MLVRLLYVSRAVDNNRGPAIESILEASRESIVKGSKSFRSASRLFDPEVREDACWCWC